MAHFRHQRAFILETGNALRRIPIGIIQHLDGQRTAQDKIMSLEYHTHPPDAQYGLDLIICQHAVHMGIATALRALYFSKETKLGNILLQAAVRAGPEFRLFAHDRTR